MIASSNFFQQTFLGNSLESYLWFAGILLSGLLLKRYISNLLSQLLYRLFKRYGKHVGIRKFIDLLSAPFGFLFLVLIIYIAFNRLTFPQEWNLDPGNVFGVRFVLNQFFQGAIVLAVTWIMIRIVEFSGLVIIQKTSETEAKLNDQLVPFAKEALKVIIAGIGFFVMLAVAFKLDVVSLITGLGIGGLAIALAAKETLENLIGSFTIFLDKPFIVGDLVRVGTVEGRVEGIGFRSTRIRAIDKMQVIVPNKKMIEAELINDSERTMHRAYFTIGLTYDTTADQLKAVIHDIGDILSHFPSLEPNHVVRFHQFGNSSLDILVIYYVNTPIAEKFLIVREEINFKIMEIVNKHNCKFAFPSSTVYLHKD